MLNSPCNPTGAVYDAAELSAILELAAERDWWVISDEIYERIAYGVAAPSALDLVTERDRLVIINGVAKSFAMTGWRVGWAIASRAAAQAMTAFQSHTTSNAASVSQHAALAALTQREEADRAVAAMVERFRARRDAAMRALAAAPSLEYVRPDGAFYLYLDVSAIPASDGNAGSAFAKHLLEAHDVAVVPGSAFLTPGWVRLSYAAPDEQVARGVERVIAAYGELAR
jgi:aspartate aminotransferase